MEIRIARFQPTTLNHREVICDVSLVFIDDDGAFCGFENRDIKFQFVDTPLNRDSSTEEIRNYAHSKFQKMFNFPIELA